jgi:antitoxin component YwqK of YwqJK toxin-antitoxin module
MTNFPTKLATLSLLLLISSCGENYGERVLERHPDGSRKSQGYLNEIGKNGTWTTWYEGGGAKRSEGHYKDGKLESLYTYWHDNGQKRSEGHYKDGKPDGLYTYWHENGQKKEEGHYKDGKKEGLWTDYWHENGQKALEGNFKDSKKEGLNHNGLDRQKQAQ